MSRLLEPLEPSLRKPCSREVGVCPSSGLRKGDACGTPAQVLFELLRKDTIEISSTLTNKHMTRVGESAMNPRTPRFSPIPCIPLGTRLSPLNIEDFTRGRRSSEGGRWGVPFGPGAARQRRAQSRAGWPLPPGKDSMLSPLLPLRNLPPLLKHRHSEHGNSALIPSVIERSGCRAQPSSCIRSTGFHSLACYW